MSDDTTTFYDRGEFIAATQDPQYASSPRYRAEVEAKLARSMAAGTISTMGEQRGGQRRVSTLSTSFDNADGATLFGGVHSADKGDPFFGEALQIDSGFFEAPDGIARAQAAPHWNLDAGYRRAVQAKVDRSIREGFLTADLQPTGKTLKARPGQ